MDTRLIKENAETQNQSQKKKDLHCCSHYLGERAKSGNQKEKQRRGCKQRGGNELGLGDQKVDRRMQRRIGEAGEEIHRAKECERRSNWGYKRRRESKIDISDAPMKLITGNNGRSKEKQRRREMGKQSRGGEETL